MAQKLTERYVINLMKEEWTNKVKSVLLEKEAKPVEKGKRRLKDLIDVDGDGYSEMVIGPGLKVTCKNGPLKGIDYDVVSVGKNEVVLSRGDINGQGKKQVTISLDDFKTNYTM